MAKILKKLKDIRIIIIIILFLAILGLGVFGYLKLTEKDNMIANQQSQIADLEGSLSAIGELVPAYVTAGQVESGKKIEETDLTVVDVPLGIAENIISDYETELDGKYYKINMAPGTILTRDVVYDEILGKDMRYYDIMLDVLPVGLEAGDYIDIRIKFGTGADYLGISHIQVQGIYGNCLKLIMSEKDIHVYSSMLVDSIVFNTQYEFSYDKDGDGKIASEEREKLEAIGSYLYATVYVEAGFQGPSEVSYAPSKLVQSLMNNDNNIKEADLTETEMLLYQNLRNTFNSSMTKGLVKYNIGDFIVNASNIRTEVQNKVKEAQKAYDKAVEEALKAAEG